MTTKNNPLTCEDCRGLDADCDRCGGSGCEPGFEIGDRIVIRADDGTVNATITNYNGEWFEIAQDGLTDDLPSIHLSLILGPAGEPSLTLEAVDALVARLTAAPARKPNAHVAAPFAEILNAFGGR